MNQTRLDAIRARCEAATPGPWTVEKLGRYEDHDEVYINLADDELEIESRRVTGTSYGNAEFIAHARTDVPDLLAEIERLTAELAAMESDRDVLREEIQQWRDGSIIVKLSDTEADRDAWRRRAECMESDLIKTLRAIPVGMCKQFCKRYRANCGVWGECNPEWRGPEVEKE